LGLLSSNAELLDVRLNEFCCTINAVSKALQKQRKTTEPLFQIMLKINKSDDTINVLMTQYYIKVM